MQIIGLVDCNSFFASCERVFSPQLEKRPVIVLSNNDGCVIARSTEAKELGIRMGTPYFQIQKLCLLKKVAVFSPNFTLYADMSRRVMATLHNWTSDVEVYSIDEAFLNLSGIPDAEMPKLHEEITSTVKRWTGIPVTLGVGPTKTLAKIANDAAKRHGISSCCLTDPALRHDILKEMDVGDIWGVGRQIYKKLKRLGIHTALDLVNTDPLWIRKNFTVIQERMVRELQGEPCLEWNFIPETQKSLQVSRTFGEKIRSLEDLEKPVTHFISQAAKQLRESGLLAGGGCLTISTSRFTIKGDPENGVLPGNYSPSIAFHFPYPTNNTLIMIKSIIHALQHIYREGYLYHRAGILLMALESEESYMAQMRLFHQWNGLNHSSVLNMNSESGLSNSAETPVSSRKDALMYTIDSLNARYGQGTVKIALEGTDSRQSWHSKQNHRSPNFTSDWNELPEAK